MSLENAILGLLTIKPMSGYSMKRDYFDQSIGFFWPADQAQIYRTLDRLLKLEHVTVQTDDSGPRPARKIYSISEKGFESLINWLGQAHNVSAERFPFLVQVYAGRHMPKEAFLRILNAYRDIRHRKLQEYQAIKLEPGENELMRSQMKFGQYTLDFGLRYEQMQLDWVDQVIAKVESEEG
ncbi:MAG: PadR family transcriptional regulator [Parasphingorhabdus sp.]